ncbi:MAG: hypothetical protein ACXADL_06845 [Candidatus Thorarchaeota archaeon]
MSSRKTTKKKTSKKTKIVKTRGMGLSVKLFKYSGLSLSASQLSQKLKAITYSPKSKKAVAAGFTRVSVKGTAVVGEFVAGFRVSVLSYDKEGNLIPVSYISIDRGDVFIKMDRGTVEVRGSERIARKFGRVFEEVSGAKISALNLNGGTKKVYDAATDIASVLLSGVEKGNLTQAEFRGEGIQTEEEIGLYTRRYKAAISRFRGTFAYPSGAFLTTSINADSGSLMIYRSGDGIQERDLDWIIKLMEDSAV